jgi:hypothetical protein
MQIAILHLSDIHVKTGADPVLSRGDAIKGAFHETSTANMNSGRGPTQQRQRESAVLATSFGIVSGTPSSLVLPSGSSSHSSVLGSHYACGTSPFMARWLVSPAPSSMASSNR